MCLFQVSEEGTIRRFALRIPIRDDLDRTTGLVWAIDEARLCNFLTPRNCPRVTCHTRDNTTREDRQRFFPRQRPATPLSLKADGLAPCGIQPCICTN